MESNIKLNSERPPSKKPESTKPNKSKEMTNISRTLSTILRHSAKDHGLDIESSGYIKLDDILNLQALKKKKVTFEMILDLVKSCEKQRFQLENRPPYYIRATQGHSMTLVKNDETLKKLENYANYPIVVHGTNTAAWEIIKSSGLNKMGRNCIRKNYLL